MVAGTPISLQALSRMATTLLPPKVNRGGRAGEKPFDPSNPFPVGAIVASKSTDGVPHGKSAPKSFGAACPTSRSNAGSFM